MKNLIKKSQDLKTNFCWRNPESASDNKGIEITQVTNSVTKALMELKGDITAKEAYRLATNSKLEHYSDKGINHVEIGDHVNLDNGVLKISQEKPVIDNPVKKDELSVKKSEKELEQGQTEKKWLSFVKIKQEELDKSGITSEQKEAYGYLSDKLYKNITPRDYNIYQASKQFLFGPDETREVSKIQDLNAYEKYTSGEITREELRNNDDKTTMGEDDAWALYLGIPQKYNTFSISKYKPSNSSDDIYYYSMPKYEDKMLEFCLGIGKHGSPAGESPDLMVLRNYKIDWGEDGKGYYLSYYDIYDLNPSGLDMEKIIGKKFEIYNRIYFNPETGKRLNM